MSTKVEYALGTNLSSTNQTAAAAAVADSFYGHLFSRGWNCRLYEILRHRLSHLYRACRQALIGPAELIEVIPSWRWGMHPCPLTGRRCRAGDVDWVTCVRGSQVFVCNWKYIKVGMNVRTHEGHTHKLYELENLYNTLSVGKLPACLNWL